MAKDLSGTNIAVQKEATFYTPIWLVDLVRDHPETGESIFRLSSWPGTYTVGGNDYVGLFDADRGIADVRMYIEPGGGLAIISDWSLALVNPTDFPSNRRLSDMLDDYFLENDEVRLSLVFKTGAETADDVLRMFTGLVKDARIKTKTFSLSAKDGTRQTLRTIPQEFLDRVQYIGAPLNVQDLPYPMAFGNMNVEPWDTTGADTTLAACMALDIFDNQYTSGFLSKTYGQPYVFYRSARFYGRIEDYTQTGATFTIDSASRFAKIKPIRAAATNDVTTWKNALDFDLSTGATLTSGKNLDLDMRGSPKLGTITAIAIQIEAAGGYDYVITKTGEANIAGSASGAATIDISAWDFSSDWDFEAVGVQIDGTGAATINLVTLDITFDEQETGADLAFPVFQSISGYADVAAQYEDGGVIVSANQVLRNPIHVALAMARDHRTGMRLAAAGIHTDNIAAEVAKISDWYFDFSLSRQMSIDQFGQMLRHGKVRMFRTFDNLWKFSVFDKTDDPVAAFFDDTNIATRTPAALPENRESSFELFQSPIEQVYNEFVVDYGWNPALGVFTKQTVSTHHYNLTGTATLDPAAETLTDLSATFQTAGVQVGHKVFVVRDKLYTVTSVNSETEVGITPATEGDIVASRSDTYYIGPNFDFNCFRSFAKYKEARRLVIQTEFIQDDDTAEGLINFLVEYYSQRRYMARFRTWLNAVDVEIGDLVVVDHADLPPRKRPADVATISGALSKSATTIPITGTGAQLFRIGDRLIVKPAGTKLYRECLKVDSVDAVAGTIDVTARGYSGTAARPWADGDQVQRVITKWEVVEIRIVRASNEIELTVRETPRDYTPIGHASPSGTPDWSAASAEERALYGFASYPNGELVWLDEDTMVSYARS